MAMLAEPKRKKKWSLNPRGKQWTNDETKIGQKLLEKMGWSKGMGLGREEQGELEPIRLKYKNDAEGVGYEAKDDQWVAHREEFNNILGLLNGNNGTADDLEKVPIKSLEDRSKSSKARVHYHKFTRGKDLSRYSATDLACILGKRAQVEHSEENTKIAEEETNEKNKIEHLHGVTTIQRGSYQEYFAAKMAEKQSQNAVNGVLKEQKESFERENEKRVRINEDLNIVKEFCSKEKIKNEKDTVVDETTGESLKKKKKKSKTKEFEIVTTDLPTVNEENLDIDTNKKKKKKKTENADTELTESEPISKKKSKKRKIEEIVLNKAVENDGEAVPESNTKKKKKKSQTDEETSTLMGPDQSEINPQDASVEEPVQNDGELNSKKKKKKKEKEEVVLVNVQLSSDMSDPVIENGLKKSKKSNNSDNSFNVIPNGEAKNVEESPKKKKNDHDKEETPIVKDNIGEEVEVKKKSKKKKTKNIDDEQMHEDVVNDEQKSEKKKSKKNETKEMDIVQVETVEVAHQSEKKKSKKNKIAEVAVEQVDVEEVDGTQQSKKKKKKHKKEEEVVEKYTKINDSFVEIAKHDQNLQSDQVEKIGIEAMQNVVSDDTQQSKKKKKKKKQVEETEEVKEVISNSEPSNGMYESFEEIRAYPNKRKRESISDSPNGIDVHLSKTSKKIEKNSEEPPTTPKIEKCASQGAPTINHVKIEKQDVEKSCPVEIKSELKESSVVDKTETTELNQPDSAKVKLPDIILKRKYRYKLDEVPFEKFVGSNLLSLSGYGDDHRFVS